MPRSTNLLVIQPYVPRYRVPFFRGLVETLEADGIRCRVSTAAPAGQQLLRQDAAREWWMLPRSRAELYVRGHQATARGSRSSRHFADAVITGLSATSMDTWAALADRLTTGTPVGVWGHVKNYVGPPTASAEKLRRWQARHADRVFAYTPGGAEHARRWGVPDERITTVMNTVDVGEIDQVVAGTTDAQVADFRDRHDLVGRPAAAFIGGLDGAKRIDLLARALDHLWSLDPTFRLILGGRGADRWMLEPAVRRGQVLDLGFVGAEEKALIARSATALAMPGRIGLVAVEALILGLPVVTVQDAVHAPEREYLSGSWIRDVPATGPERYAEELLSVTRSAGPPPARPMVPRLTDMVARFATGCRHLLASA